MRHVWSGKLTLEEGKKKQSSAEFPGNAPPMRSLPLCFFSGDEQVALCKANANSTHPHPKACAASFIMAAGAHALIVAGKPQADVINVAATALLSSALHDAATDEHLRRLEALPDYHTYGSRFSSMPSDVHELLCGPQPNPNHVPGMIGLGSDAMRTAAVVLYILKWQSGPIDALTAAVDIGGDVDSSAALVLGVVGGSQGLRLGSLAEYLGLWLRKWRE